MEFKLGRELKSLEDCRCQGGTYPGMAQIQTWVSTTLIWANAGTLEIWSGKKGMAVLIQGTEKNE